MRIHSPLSPWSKVVWFKLTVPRFSFITWLAMKGRLPTKDRLRGWVLTIPAVCVLCSNGIETHDHLFFASSYSKTIWHTFASRILPNHLVTLSYLLLDFADTNSGPFLCYHHHQETPTTGVLFHLAGA